MTGYQTTALIHRDSIPRPPNATENANWVLLRPIDRCCTRQEGKTWCWRKGNKPFHRGRKNTKGGADSSADGTLKDASTELPARTSTRHLR